MSANLLLDSEKPHALEDDRESALHVLTWTALRYTKHSSISMQPDASARFLRGFDEAYVTKGGVKGGDLKSRFLLGRDISRTIKFDGRPQLDQLIRELTQAFAVRYEEPPLPDEFEELEEMRLSGAPPSSFKYNVVFRYQQRMENLADPDWLVNTFRRHLNTGDWPNDKAEGQPLGTGSKTKRGREQVQLESRIPKSRRLSVGSSSRVLSG